MKKILITGKSSYLGNSFQEYIKEQCPDWTVDAISIRDDAWKKIDFSPYDCVLHMAGKAHADVGNVSEEVKKELYELYENDCSRNKLDNFFITRLIKNKEKNLKVIKNNFLIRIVQNKV